MLISVIIYMYYDLQICQRYSVLIMSVVSSLCLMFPHVWCVLIVSAVSSLCLLCPHYVCCVL